MEYQCWDLSLAIWKDLNSDFYAIEDFCVTNKIKPDVQQRLYEYLSTAVAKIYQANPDMTFAMSMISDWSQPICKMLCEIIRSQGDSVILIGGPGVNESQWLDSMVQKNLIDHYVMGEGELPFRAFLQGNMDAPGLDNQDFEQIDDLDQYCVIPDYSKLPVDDYPYLDNVRSFFITASRGCVRRCGYCNVGYFWKKYRYRSSKHVAEEMITQYEKHGVRDFFFTDSLINGSLKQFEGLCDELIAYKERNPAADFRWRGQYIFRPKDQVKERHIEKMARAGVDYLIIGLETGSDRVRYEMDKKHTTDDAEWSLEMFKKYGISCHLLMLTGWVTETLEDHLDTMALFSRWQKFVASGTISGIELGSTLAVIDHTPVSINADQHRLVVIDDKPYLWYSENNPDLTIWERYRRRMETHREAIKYKWPVTRGLYRLSTIHQNLQESIEYLQQNPMPRYRPKFEIKSS